MSVVVELSPAPSDTFEEETHIVCCDNTDHALCGTMVAGDGFLADETNISCIVCLDLDEANYCPYTGLCRH